VEAVYHAIRNASSGPAHVTFRLGVLPRRPRTTGPKRGPRFDGSPRTNHIRINMARTHCLLSAPSRHGTDQSLAGSASPDASLEKASTDVEKDGDVQILAASINESLAAAEGIDVQFMAKAGVINGALEECGMGRFQVS
jgi:hypothetical protein